MGAPPSYVGYNDSKADHYFTQEQLDKHHTTDLKLTIVLLDEIEKAHQDFYQYLLAIFNDGKGRVDGKDVDFSRVLFVMTSNLGTTDIQRSIGFSQSQLEQLNRENQVHPSRRTKYSSRARGRRCPTDSQPLYAAASKSPHALIYYRAPPGSPMHRSVSGPPASPTPAPILSTLCRSRSPSFGPFSGPGLPAGFDGKNSCFSP